MNTATRRGWLSTAQMVTVFSLILVLSSSRAPRAIARPLTTAPVHIGYLAGSRFESVLGLGPYQALSLAEVPTAAVEAIALTDLDLAQSREDPALRAALYAAYANGKVLLGVNASLSRS